VVRDAIHPPIRTNPKARACMWSDAGPLASNKDHVEMATAEAPLKLVGTHNFSTGSRRQVTENLRIDCLLDEPDGAIAEQKIAASRMQAMKVVSPCFLVVWYVDPRFIGRRPRMSKNQDV
jgi:hypothetical protein